MSLPAQTAAAIRTAIDNGVWRGLLPSERQLCEMFQVSRPTISTALHLLAQEGRVIIRQGRRNRLVPQVRHGSANQNRLVGLITSEPVSRLSLLPNQGISEMRTHLMKHGFVTQTLVCRARSPRVQRRKLAEFVRQNRVFCCVLISVRKEVQQWFVANSVPALVLGSCHPNIRLPSLDIDHRSVCRHAAGVFLRNGHRRMALVIPDANVAGDLASENGFREAIEQGPHKREARATVVRHNGTAGDITRKLDALFDSPDAPTALLVAKPQHVFIVIIYLLKRGLTVPDTISFIARDPEYYLEIADPPISHYKFEREAFINRLSRLMLRMVAHGRLNPEPNLMFPKFFAGGTVKSIRR